MSTRHVLDRLPLWVGGDVPAAEQEAIREHLAGCEPCRREAMALLESQAWLRGAPSAPFTGEDQLAFRRDVMARIQAEGRAPRSLRQPFPWKMALLAAAGLLVAWLSQGLRHRPGKEAAPPVREAVLTPAELPPKPAPATAVGALPTRHLNPRATPAALPESGEPARIELQTDNPNVRIIWLARATAEPAVPDPSNDLN